MPRWIDTASALLVLVGAACGGDDDDDQVDAGTEVDAAIDTDPDAGPTAGLLVGRWELRDESGDLQASYEFDADGAFRFDEVSKGSEEHATGQYSVDESTLILSGTEPDRPDVAIRLEVTYHASAEHLSLGPLLPEGQHEGIVGTWKGHSKFEETPDGGEPTVIMGADEVLTAHADGKVDLHITRLDGGPDEELSGTWTEVEENRFETEIRDGAITVTSTRELLDGSALGGDIFDRAGRASHRHAHREAPRLRRR